MTLSNLVVLEFKNYKIQFLTKSLLLVARPMIVPITASKSFDLDFLRPSLLKIFFERKLIKNGEFTYFNLTYKYLAQIDFKIDQVREV